jgi:hypothetical protein
MLMDLLRRRGKLRPEDLTRLRLTAPVELTLLKQDWLDALEAAESFVQSRPSEELGCLYYSPEQRTFVLPQPGDLVVPHFGRPGGVLPLISDADE